MGSLFGTLLRGEVDYRKKRKKLQRKNKTKIINKNKKKNKYWNSMYDKKYRTDTYK